MKTKKVLLGCVSMGMLLGLVACGGGNGDAQEVCEDGVEKLCAHEDMCKTKENGLDDLEDCVKRQISTVCKSSATKARAESCDKQGKKLDFSEYERCTEYYGGMKCGTSNEAKTKTGEQHPDSASQHCSFTAATVPCT
ncbi:MAG: hypothetical protein FWC28_07005 [Proteobacteria bacterium]|nr:hypothetical protein [Pseudomonadota bacterium]